MKPKVKKVLRIVWISLASTFLIWNWSAFQSRNLPSYTFLSTESISVVETDDTFTFQSHNPAGKTEIIFFPGGLADPKAYAPLCRKIAENGFTVHLIKMSFRMPQFDYEKILRLFDLQESKYIIGGHSQGGKMAAQFVFENPGKMKGLFLLGTSHPRNFDLSSQHIPVLKLYAENDGLASMDEVIENSDKLPKTTKFNIISGGNHSQFGYLGLLLGDNEADISLEKQQSIITENMLSFLNTL